jgi:hypothetical protein
MKFKLVLLLFIGMISFTGFSASTDLTKNSELAFNVDNDVGSFETLIAEQVENFVDDLIEVKTQEINQSTVVDYAVNNYSYSENYRSLKIDEPCLPDIHSMANSSSKTPKTILKSRTARDSLNYN